MEKKSVLLLASLVMLVMAIPAPALAQSQLPPALQKIADYNRALEEDFSARISFFVAFIAGALTFLSPCVLPLLPAYFANTFKEKGNVALMTAIFALGISTTMVLFGIAAGFLGEQGFATMQKPAIVVAAGVFMVTMGLLTIFGKWFSPSSSFGKVRSISGPIGVYLSGAFFAVGWSVCVGPILSGILGIAAVLGDIYKAVFLMLAYSLGLSIPLFIFSVFYERMGLARSAIIRGKTIRAFGREFHSTSLISGLLLISVGLVYIFLQGTGFVNYLDFLSLRQYFYSGQSALLSFSYSWALGLAVFLLVAGLLIYAIMKGKPKGEPKESEGKLKRKRRKDGA